MMMQVELRIVAGLLSAAPATATGGGVTTPISSAASSRPATPTAASNGSFRSASSSGQQRALFLRIHCAPKHCDGGAKKQEEEESLIDRSRAADAAARSIKLLNENLDVRQELAIIVSVDKQIRASDHYATFSGNSLSVAIATRCGEAARLATATIVDHLSNARLVKVGAAGCQWGWAATTAFLAPVGRLLAVSTGGGVGLASLGTLDLQDNELAVADFSRLTRLLGAPPFASMDPRMGGAIAKFDKLLLRGNPAARNPAGCRVCQLFGNTLVPRHAVGSAAAHNDTHDLGTGGEDDPVYIDVVKDVEQQAAASAPPSSTASSAVGADEEPQSLPPPSSSCTSRAPSPGSSMRDDSAAEKTDADLTPIRRTTSKRPPPPRRGKATTQAPVPVRGAVAFGSRVPPPRSEPARAVDEPVTNEKTGETTVSAQRPALPKPSGARTPSRSGSPSTPRPRSPMRLKPEKRTAAATSTTRAAGVRGPTTNTSTDTERSSNEGAARTQAQPMAIRHEDDTHQNCSGNHTPERPFSKGCGATAVTPVAAAMPAIVPIPASQVAAVERQHVSLAEQWHRAVLELDRSRSLVHVTASAVEATAQLLADRKKPAVRRLLAAMQQVPGGVALPSSACPAAAAPLVASIRDKALAGEIRGAVQAVLGHHGRFTKHVAAPTLRRCDALLAAHDEFCVTGGLVDLPAPGSLPVRGGVAGAVSAALASVLGPTKHSDRSLLPASPLRVVLSRRDNAPASGTLTLSSGTPLRPGTGRPQHLPQHGKDDNAVAGATMETEEHRELQTLWAALRSAHEEWVAGLETATPAPSGVPTFSLTLRCEMLKHLLSLRTKLARHDDAMTACAECVADLCRRYRECGVQERRAVAPASRPSISNASSRASSTHSVKGPNGKDKPQTTMAATELTPNDDQPHRSNAAAARQSRPATRPVIVSPPTAPATGAEMRRSSVSPPPPMKFRSNPVSPGGGTSPLHKMPPSDDNTRCASATAARRVTERRRREAEQRAREEMDGSFGASGRAVKRTERERPWTAAGGAPATAATTAGKLPSSRDEQPRGPAIAASAKHTVPSSSRSSSQMRAQQQRQQPPLRRQLSRRPAPPPPHPSAAMVMVERDRSDVTLSPLDPSDASCYSDCDDSGSLLSNEGKGRATSQRLFDEESGVGGEATWAVAPSGRGQKQQAQRRPPQLALVSSSAANTMAASSGREESDDGCTRKHVPAAQACQRRNPASPRRLTRQSTDTSPNATWRESRRVTNPVEDPGAAREPLPAPATRRPGTDPTEFGGVGRARRASTQIVLNEDTAVDTTVAPPFTAAPPLAPATFTTAPSVGKSAFERSPPPAMRPAATASPGGVRGVPVSVACTAHADVAEEEATRRPSSFSRSRSACSPQRAHTAAMLTSQLVGSTPSTTDEILGRLKDTDPQLFASVSAHLQQKESDIQARVRQRMAGLVHTLEQSGALGGGPRRSSSAGRRGGAGGTGRRSLVSMDGFDHTELDYC